MLGKEEEDLTVLKDALDLGLFSAIGDVGMVMDLNVSDSEDKQTSVLSVEWTEDDTV